ncbi:hypothetical protein GCM10007094_43370 [Pseudovibrio japonicus]|uniref:Aminoglycoside phosphotransferase domain-containing protein n=1 Tax=Pseudovibrio japonicus TaxID=366534 RepID=A0ABQ3EP72_9HYPH|nr:aminoglycoside phosphotransferase family protein [Pseudovibrio japonicus]GHB49451.1 hypothetical protein GCM10007094_43370 [Pseudovibrio japonicus]
MNKQEIKLLDEAFALPEDTKWSSFGEGHANETWLGELDGEESVVLRRHNPNKTEAQILSEFKCLDLLQNIVGYEVPKALYGVNQERVTEVEGAHYSLFELIEGETPALDKVETCRQAGQALANVHIKLWEERDVFRFSENERPGVSKQTLKSGTGLLAALSELEASKSIDAKYLSTAYWADVDRALDEVLGKLGSLNETKHLIHGDYGPGNTLINKSTGELVGLLDWDECRWDLPVYDVVGVYPFLCEIDQSLGEAFVEAYFAGLNGSSHPLASRESETRDLIGAVQYVTTYKEFELMVDNHLDEPEYLAQLLEQLA